MTPFPFPALVHHAKLCDTARGRWHDALALGERLRDEFTGRVVSAALLLTLLPGLWWALAG